MKIASRFGSAIILFLFALWAYDMGEVTRFFRFFAFQTRDLARAQGLLDGQWIFFGPETTGGGHLPGPFYYLLLAAALWIQNHWMAALKLLVGLSAAACSAGALYFFSRFGRAAAVIWAGLFILSAPLENYLGVFLNVSYMVFFLVLAIICICESFVAPAARTRTLAFAAACVFIALSIQLHYSALVLIGALAFLQDFAPRFHLPRLTLRSVLSGLAVGTLPLLPFILWGRTPGFSGESQDALPSLFAFLDLPPWDRINYGFIFLLHALPLALPVFMAASILEWLVSGRRRLEKTARISVVPLVTCAAFGVLPALYIFVAPIGLRYGLVFTVAALFLAAYWLSQPATKLRLFLFNLIGLLTILAVFSWNVFEDGLNEFHYGLHSRHLVVALLAMLALVFAQKATVRQPLVLTSVIMTFLLAWVQNPSLWKGRLARHQMAVPAFAEWKRISLRICRDTGWDAQRMFDSIYFVNGHMEQDPMPIFKTVTRVCKMEDNALQPAGYFVSFLVYVNERPFAEWLLEQNIHEDIKTGVRNGDIELGKAESLGTAMILVPYWVRDQKNLPPYFHNLGVGYAESESQRFLRKWVDPSGVKQIADRQYLLSWNECPERAAYCETGVLLRLEPGARSTKIHVDILGDSLSQSSPWITPEWTQSWTSPYIEVMCGRRIEKFALNSVGYERQYGYNVPSYSFYLSNHGLLTPLKRVFEVACAITEIAVGRQATTIDRVHSMEERPAQRRSVSL